MGARAIGDRLSRIGRGPCWWLMRVGPSAGNPGATDGSSDDTIAALARLEALANVEANKAGSETNTARAGKLTDGCRLAYSSVLVAESRKEAQAFLAHIFTDALTKNPPKGIGGILYYDEQTSAIVQVLEGPSEVTRSLFHDKISQDRRHTSVKLLWDRPVNNRQYEGFGMQLGSDPEAVLVAGKEGELLQLTYVSQLTASGRDEAYEHIKDILAVAIVANPKLHIGGALFLNPRTLQVLQALEGPEENVRGLYAKIVKDTRHNDCKIVSELKVETRAYDQWGMLQGDLADWSKLATGKAGMNNVLARRRGRYAREDLDVEGEQKFGGASQDLPLQATPSQDATIKGEIHVGEQGTSVVPAM